VTIDITTALAEIANRPAASWRVLLARKFPDDPALVHQALVWLHANKAPDDTPDDSPGRYQLGVMLDGGATAAVWQAHDPQARSQRRDQAVPDRAIAVTRGDPCRGARRV